MMVKVFTPNAAGKIEFTKDELEKLLNEVWWDGSNTNNYLWTSPHIPTWYATTKTVKLNEDNFYTDVTGVKVSLKGEDDG